MRIKIFGICFVIAVWNFGAESLPLNLAKRHAVNVFGNYSSEKLITFMQTFGYLQEPSMQTEGLQAEFLYAETSIVEGIKHIQKFGALDETGVLDEKTIKLLSSPRCGVKDVMSGRERQKRFIIGAKNWQKRQISYFIANWSPKVEEAKMVQWVAQAFEAWSLYSRLKFKRVFDSSADIIIAFGSSYHGDRYPFDGPGNILAHAFYPYEENSFGGDIHFDNDENWKENATSMNEGVDFLTVLTHELGHSLGLAHSPVFSSLMFPYYKGTTPAQLDYDDILAMYQMYITRPLVENSDDVTNSDSEIVGSSDNATEKITRDEEEHEVITVKASEESEETEAETDNERRPSHEDERDENDSNEVPDMCEGHFDVVTYIKGKVYVIKENFIWQFNEKFELDDGFPVKTRKFFPNLPKRFKKIDAAYEIAEEGEIVLFSGTEYITYDPRGPIYNSYNITRYTNDPDIEKIDAAMIWSKNNKTYLFSADRFWKYSEQRKMAPYYPRVMGRWNGIPENLDAAISIPDGKTIFFQGSDYWLFDDVNVKPVQGYPRDIAELFEYC